MSAKPTPSQARPARTGSSAGELRVLIADDHPAVRHGLRAILQSQPDIHVIADAADGEEACRLCDELCPDVLLLDLRMPKKDGFQVTAELRSRVGALKPGIIVMSTYEGEEDIRRALSAGVKGYLTKGTAPEQIRDAVRRVAAGEALLPAGIASKLAASLAQPELSDRERQVLQSIAAGRSNKEIGQGLYISENTVKHHVKSVLKKLNAVGRTEAVTIATKRGLLRFAI